MSWEIDFKKLSRIVIAQRLWSKVKKMQMIGVSGTN